MRVALGVTLAFEGWVLAHYLRGPVDPRDNLAMLLVSTPAFLVAVALFARSGIRGRAAVLFVLSTGALFQLLALTVPPRTSDDDFRYIWDAKVQLSGTDPYRFTPVAPQLARLREPLIFPTNGACPHRVGNVCTTINRPTVRTVYPPVAQAAFVALRLASFGDDGQHLALQLAAAVGAVIVAWLLARRVLARHRPPWLVAVWAWCPVTISEFGNNAHIDWLGVLFVVLAITSNAARRSGLTGALMGAAIATKLYPALVLPSLLRRRPWVVLGSAFGVVALSYLPHVLAVGTTVIGYLPGYLREEQYVSGDRLLLLNPVLGHPIDTFAGALILGVVTYWAWRRTDPDVPEASAVVVVGVALLVTTPNYGWYATMLIALIVLSGAIEWLPVAFAPSVTYLYRAVDLHTGVPSSVIYLAAAALTATGYLLRTAGRLGTCRPSILRTTAGSPSSVSTTRR